MKGLLMDKFLNVQFVVKKGEKSYVFLVPYGSPVTEVHEVLVELSADLIETAKQNQASADAKAMADMKAEAEAAAAAEPKVEVVENKAN
jgi:hypothetical protein